MNSPDRGGPLPDIFACRQILPAGAPSGQFSSTRDASPGVGPPGQIRWRGAASAPLRPSRRRRRRRRRRLSDPAGPRVLRLSGGLGISTSHPPGAGSNAARAALQRAHGPGLKPRPQCARGCTRRPFRLPRGRPSPSPPGIHRLHTAAFPPAIRVHRPFPPAIRVHRPFQPANRVHRPFPAISRRDFQGAASGAPPQRHRADAVAASQLASGGGRWTRIRGWWSEGGGGNGRGTGPATLGRARMRGAADTHTHNSFIECTIEAAGQVFCLVEMTPSAPSRRPPRHRDEFNGFPSQRTHN